MACIQLDLFRCNAAEESARECAAQLLHIGMVSGDWPLGARYVGRIGERDVRRLCGTAIHDAHDDVLRNVNETAREVAGVCRSERRVGETLTRTVCGDEVLEHRHPLAEV